MGPGSLLRIECNPPHSDPPAEIHWEIQGPNYDWEPLSLDETMTVSFEGNVTDNHLRAHEAVPYCRAIVLSVC